MLPISLSYSNIGDGTRFSGNIIKLIRLIQRLHTSTKSVALILTDTVAVNICCSMVYHTAIDVAVKVAITAVVDITSCAITNDKSLV